MHDTLLGMTMKMPYIGIYGGYFEEMFGFMCMRPSGIPSMGLDVLAQDTPCLKVGVGNSQY